VSAALSAPVTAIDTETIDPASLHLATGRDSFDAVIHKLIEEFGVTPRRPDWRETLARTETTFQDEIRQRI
jgi:hypothetical protein